jgi:hypothetical protein
VFVGLNHGFAFDVPGFEFGLSDVERTILEVM